MTIASPTELVKKHFETREDVFLTFRFVVMFGGLPAIFRTVLSMLRPEQLQLLEFFRERLLSDISTTTLDRFYLLRALFVEFTASEFGQEMQISKPLSEAINSAKLSFSGNFGFSNQDTFLKALRRVAGDRVQKRNNDIFSAPLQTQFTECSQNDGIEMVSGTYYGEIPLEISKRQKKTQEQEDDSFDFDEDEEEEEFDD